MNIKIDIEMTPEEMRRLVGLPDVSEFNREVMSHMLKRMQEGMDGYDPVAFFRSGIVGNTDLLKNWMDLFGKFGTSTKSGN